MYIQWFQKSSADKNKRKEKKEDRLIFLCLGYKNSTNKRHIIMYTAFFGTFLKTQYWIRKLIDDSLHVPIKHKIYQSYIWVKIKWNVLTCIFI